MPPVLPLFPLHAHVLPGGLLTLRIFEQKYLRMIADVCKSDGSFGICMVQDYYVNSKKVDILSIGTCVKIVDFDSLGNNILGVKVRGLSKFHLLATHMEVDGLLVGKVEFMENWASIPITESQTILCGKLQEIFNTYPYINELYEVKDYDDASWVSQRLIELLPFESELKQELIACNDCKRTLDFLMQSCETSINEC